MRREFFSVVMLLLLLATTAAISYWVIKRMGKPKSQLREKRENADLVKYYVVDKDQGPTFELRRNDKIIKLITHVELSNYEPKARIQYGFHLHIRSPDGHREWNEVIYTRTRQSKEGEIPTGYLYENTFGINPGEQYGDDRLLEIRLPSDLPEGGHLELRLLGGSGDVVQIRRALIRAYRQIERSSVSQQLRLLALSERGKQSLSERVGTPWDLIPRQTRLAMLSRRWDRMAALGEEGIDYRTQVVFYTGFRVRNEAEDEKQGVHIHAKHHAAINVLVEDQTTLTLKAMQYTPNKRCEPKSDAPVEVGDLGTVNVDIDIHMVSDTQTLYDHVTIPPGASGVTHSLIVPAGLHSIQFRTKSQNGAAFCLIADTNEQLQFGYLDPIPVGVDLEQLIVDVRRMPAYLSGIGEDKPPIATYIDGPPDKLEARTFMIDMRVLMDEKVWSGRRPTMTYRFLDERGLSVGRGVATLIPTHAPFEKVRLNGRLVLNTDSESPSWQYQQRDEATGKREKEDDAIYLYGVSEPIRFRVIAPPSARRLEVETDLPSAIRVLGYLSDKSRYEMPYREHVPVSMSWRYAPRELRPWYPTRPENRDILADTGRIIRVRTQVRLEKPIPEEDRSGDRQAVLIEPVRPEQRQIILEPVPRERKPEFQQVWPTGMYTLLDRQRQIQVSQNPTKRPRIRYFLEGDDAASLLGLSVQVTANNQPTLTRRLVTPRSIWTLPYLPAGTPFIECKLLGTPEKPVTIDQQRQLKCYIDRPPRQVVGTTIVRARTVFPLNHRPLRLHIDKKPRRDVVLNAVIYAGLTGGIGGKVIHATVDGGRPKRALGAFIKALTKADRWFPLPKPSVLLTPKFVDLAGRTPGYPRHIAMRLGDDLIAGTHIVTLNAPIMDGWVRFFTYDIDPNEAESAWQWKFEAPEAEVRSKTP